MKVLEPMIPADFTKFAGNMLIEWDVDRACVLLDMDEWHLNGWRIATASGRLAPDARCPPRPGRRQMNHRRISRFRST